MRNSDFIERMKKSGFTEKDINELIMISRRDGSDFQSDVKNLALRFYRILFSFSFVIVLMVAFLSFGKSNDGTVFLFLVFMFVFSILWYITPVKFSYKSHRMYKKYM